MKLNYKLRDGKKGVTILLELRIGSIRVRKSTNYVFASTSKKYWNHKSQRFNYPNDIPNSNIINQNLNDFSNKIAVGIENLILSNSLSEFNCLKLIYDITNQEKKSVKKLEKNSKMIFLNYFDYYIEFYASNPTFKTNKPLASGTIRTLKNARNFFETFLKESKIDTKKFTFNDICNPSNQSGLFSIKF